MKNFITLKTRQDDTRNYDPDKRIDTSTTDVFVNINSISAFVQEAVGRTKVVLGSGMSCVYVLDEPEDIIKKIEESRNEYDHTDNLLAAIANEIAKCNEAQ